MGNDSRSKKNRSAQRDFHEKNITAENFITRDLINCGRCKINVEIGRNDGSYSKVNIDGVSEHNIGAVLRDINTNIISLRNKKRDRP